MIENTDEEQIERLNGRIVELLREVDRLKPYVEAFQREETRADKLGSRVDELEDRLAGNNSAQRPLDDDAKMVSRCLEILETVPGENLIDRVSRIFDWHRRLSDEYHALSETLSSTERPFHGAECPSYPNCDGGCGLGCTKEIERHRAAAPPPVERRDINCSCGEECMDLGAQGGCRYTLTSTERSGDGK